MEGAIQLPQEPASYTTDNIFHTNVLYQYFFLQKLKNQPVDDAATFEKIGQILADLARKIVSIVSAEGVTASGVNVKNVDIVPFYWLTNLPRLVAVKFSPISHLLHRDAAAEIGDLIQGLVNSPRKLLPPFSCKY